MVPYNMRQEGRDALAVWFAEDYDEQCFFYLSGARGVATGHHVGTSWTGRANNSLSSPDSDHIIYGGDATSSATIETGDTMELSIIERLVAKAETTDPMIQPIKIGGENKHILLMHTWQAYDLRNAVSENDWVDIHKNTDGKDSIIYKNSLGEYAGVILHKHRNVVRFSTYGSGGTYTAARALFLGAQAGMIAWGGGGGPGRYSWNEEKDDRGNALAITAGVIYAVDKAVFNSKDFGVIAVDTYCDDPNS